MNLYLISKQNKNYDPDIITCQSHCELFDKHTYKCAFYNNEVPHDPFFTSQCEYFLSSEEWESFTMSSLKNIDE